MGVSLFAADAGSLRKAPDLTFNLPGKGPQQLSEYRGKVVALGIYFHDVSALPGGIEGDDEVTGRIWRRAGLQAIDVAVNPNADLLVENFAKDLRLAFP